MGKRELHSNKPHLDPWLSDGATNVGNNFKAHEQQKIHHEYLAWIH